MTLFETLSAMVRQRDAERGAHTKEGACLCTDKDDHFFADITYHMNGNEVIHVEAAFANCVEISDNVLIEECVNAARGFLREPYTWNFNTVTRIKTKE